MPTAPSDPIKATARIKDLEGQITKQHEHTSTLKKLGATHGATKYVEYTSPESFSRNKKEELNNTVYTRLGHDAVIYKNTGGSSSAVRRQAPAVPGSDKKISLDTKSSDFDFLNNW